jgi:hypothetical protein
VFLHFIPTPLCNNNGGGNGTRATKIEKKEDNNADACYGRKFDWEMERRIGTYSTSSTPIILI